MNMESFEVFEERWVKMARERRLRKKREGKRGDMSHAVRVSGGTSKNHVYFMGAGNAVKIGIARSPEYRKRELQVGCPLELQLLLVVEGGGYTGEEVLHKRFNKYRIRGEWFTLTGQVSGFLEDCRHIAQKTKHASSEQIHYVERALKARTRVLEEVVYQVSPALQAMADYGAVQSTS